VKIDFHGQTALVTGATKGIGRQIADDLAALGASVILTGSNPEQIALLSREAEQAGQDKYHYMAVDFLDRDSTSGFLEELGRLEKIDVCINNAGINRVNFIDETLEQDWHDIAAVNLDAPFLITKAVSRIMKANGYGRIVNISSIFGVISKAKRSLYSMSKFGLRGLTVASAIDLAPHNVLVNAVSPGFVMTELTRRILSQEEMDKLAEQVPVGRFAQPEEIAKAVLFLVSSHNTYITGQNLIVDGGFVNV
jgi:NAD(P)-dependent dehydrogenase (short-subunit alcohol dehydrogenase family)